MKIKILPYLLILLLIITTLFMGASVLKAQQKDLPETSDISTQLNQILNNQQAIIDTLKKMREELHIIKIRATVKR